MEWENETRGKRQSNDRYMYLPEHRALVELRLHLYDILHLNLHKNLQKITNTMYMLFTNLCRVYKSMQ